MVDPPTGAYVRFPHVRGDSVTFVADDEVWLAPLSGGSAWRLTADHAPVSNPRLSPDANLVSWTSRRDGAPEVFVSPLDGGTARRLTYWGAMRTATRGWTAPTPDSRTTTAAVPSTLRLVRAA
nr:peptidase S41 [Nocardioidaceae bacterium]